jgi:hypothetical protein
MCWVMRYTLRFVHANYDFSDTLSGCHSFLNSGPKVSDPHRILNRALTESRCSLEICDTLLSRVWVETVPGQLWDYQQIQDLSV